MRLLRALQFTLLASTVSLGVSAFSPAVANGEQLDVIADASSITAAHPDSMMPYSLFVGQGTGMYPQLNQNGEVIFGAAMWNGDPIPPLTSSLFKYSEASGVQHLLHDGGTIQSAAGQNLQANLSASFNSSYKVTATGDGEAIMMCRLTGEGITDANNYGLVRVNQGAPSELAAQNQTSLEGLPIRSIIGAVEPDGLPGTHYIAATLNADGTESVILRRTLGAVSEIARTGSLAPQTEGARFGVFPYPLKTLRHANSNGTFAFGTTLTGKEVTPENAGAIYRADSHGLNLVVRDGDIAEGDPAECGMYGTAYSRFNINSSGKIAFHAGLNCGEGGISVFSDRSGIVKREAYTYMLLEGSTGRFRLGLLNEVTTALGTLGDNVNYQRGFLDDSGNLFVLSTILNEDHSLRSAWGIVRIQMDGTGDILLESSAEHSGLGISFANYPFPEQVSIASDGTLLVRVQELNLSSRALILVNPNREATLIRDGDIIDGYTVTVGGSNHVSGLALPEGKMFAYVTARAAHDSPNGAARGSIVAIDAEGVRSLPVVRGMTQVHFPNGDQALLQNFDNPFAWSIRRKVATDDGKLTLVGIVQREGMETEHVVLLLQSDQPAAHPADFNQDGQVNPSDIFAFLAAYFAGDLRADLDQSGALEVPDIFAFLTLYFAH